MKTIDCAICQCNGNGNDNSELQSGPHLSQVSPDNVDPRQKSLCGYQLFGGQFLIFWSFSRGSKNNKNVSSYFSNYNQKYC